MISERRRMQNRGEESRFRMEKKVVKMEKILVKMEKMKRMEKILVILEKIIVWIRGQGTSIHYHTMHSVPGRVAERESQARVQVG